MYRLELYLHILLYTPTLRLILKDINFYLIKECKYERNSK